MHTAVLLVLNFLSTVTVLVLLGVSLGLIFGQLGIINLAQGDFAMVGAFTMYAMRGVPFLVGILVAAGVGVALGLILELGLMRRLYDRGFMPALLATWGVGIVLRQGADAIFSSTPHSVNAPITSSTTIFGVQYPTYRLVAAVVVAVLVVALLTLAYRSSLGLRVRASIDNLEMASLLGISPKRMFTLVFVIATVLGVLAGAIAAPFVGITPTLGIGYLAPAFFALLLGRPGTVGGPVLGAVLVAALTVVLQQAFTDTVAQTFLFASFVLLIVVRPGGVSWHLHRSSRRPPRPARAAGPA
jgi:branched-chain amino acid transport system permease protein/urea transport system permease protein